MRPSEKSTCRQWSGHDSAQSDAGDLPGDFSALLQQIGSPAFYSARAPIGEIADLAALKLFLETYQTDILLSLELPAIAEACARVRRGEARELIALDQHLATEPFPAAFASASRQIGRGQIERLRPLRDERMVQRYLAAVESGQAHAWHTLVYGLTLAIYSLPLRQGLLHYAQETLAALAHAVARTRDFSKEAIQDILDALFVRLPEMIETAVARLSAAHPASF